jgi:hypothetical protein
VGPHSPHEGPRSLEGYSHLMITRFLVVQALSNEMVEEKKTEHFLKTDAFLGVLGSKIGTHKPPTWVERFSGVYQLTHFCVFLP